ncbi:MAG: phage tail tape measure protein [Rikenellaceae bacterium]
MTKQLTAMRTSLRETKVAAGDFTNNIGNYMSGVVNKVSIMSAAVIGFVYGLQTAFRSIYSDFQAFEYKMAQVASVSGATADELLRLEENARVLGGATEYTATQVADLQMAYSRMGFVPDQILEMTDATLDLATATGEDLAKSADVAGVVIRAFGLSAEDSTRVVDVMARSFNSSALQLDTFSESIKYVAPVAKLANISLEETAAMLGVLADNGIRGSQAGTALRRIFTDISADGKPVAERLAELSKEGISLGGAMDEVGRTAMTTLAVLAASGDSVGVLTEALRGASGAAKSAADNIRDTLQGDINNFTSALESQAISVGNFLNPLTRSVLQFSTTVVRESDNIAKAISTGAAVVATLNGLLKWNVYWAKAKATWDATLTTLAKASALATTLSNAAISGNTRTLITNATAASTASTATKLLAVAKLALTGNVTAATVALRAFNLTLSSNVIGLFLVATASAISYFAFFRTEATAAATAQEKLNAAMGEFDKKQQSRREQINSLISTIRDETTTTTQQLVAYQQLAAIFPELTEQYSRYELAKLSANDVSTLANIKEEAELYEELKKNVSVAEVELRRLNSTYSDVNSGTEFRVGSNKEIEQITEDLKLAEEALRKYEETRAKAAAEDATLTQSDPITAEQAQNQKLLELKKQLLSGQIASEKAYQEQVLQLEIDYLNERLAQDKLSLDDRIKLEEDLTDKLQKQRDADLAIVKAYNTNRKKISDEILSYERDNIDAQLALLADSVDKRIKLSERATEKSLLKSDGDYGKLKAMLDAEQSLYEQGSEEWQTIEQQRTTLQQRYEAERSAITQAGATKSEQILQSASVEELTTYANVADDKAAIEDRITAKKEAEVQKRIEAESKEYSGKVDSAYSEYTVKTTVISNDNTLTDKQKETALLQQEITLRENLAKIEQERLRYLLDSGDEGTDTWDGTISKIKDLQDELKNIDAPSKSSGGWFTSAFGLDESGVKQLKSAAIDAAQDVSNAVFDIMNDASDRQLSAQLDTIESEYDTASSLLQAKLDKDLITEAQYEDQLATLDAEYAAKQEEVEREAFEREKKLSIAQVIIDTAMSISKTFAQMGWPAGIPFAALAAVSGAAQIATISAQQYYADGGIIPIGDGTAVINGRSHAQGGHQLYIDGQPIGEVEGDELIAIVNKKDTARIGALSAANSVNGKKFANGGIVGGSYTTSSIGSPATFESTATDSAWVRSMFEKMNTQIDAVNSRIDNIKTYVVSSDITDQQTLDKKTQTRASW